MINKKRSFFERLSGARAIEEDYEFDDLTHDEPLHAQQQPMRQQTGGVAVSTHSEPERAEGQLPVDMYQTQTEIVIRAFVAGVRPDELNVSISRDMVVIEGTRSEGSQTAGPDYFNQELFWGSFARTIMLPQEVDVENASALSKDGLLTLTLPRLDRSRQTKLKIRTS